MLGLVCLVNNGVYICIVGMAVGYLRYFERRQAHREKTLFCF